MAISNEQQQDKNKVERIAVMYFKNSELYK